MAERILEIACFNLESALLAATHGANRIELCENYAEGGVTPSEDLIREAREKIKISLHVIIRPRAGNFIYTSQEIKHMQRQILFCRENGINGVVFGVLTPDRTINVTVCKALKSMAGNMPVTFHRAIDQCRDIKRQMEQLIELDIERVLTSGGKKNAAEGIQELTMLQKVYGHQLAIMPGGGIRARNIQKIIETGCHEFHSAALTDNIKLADVDELKKLRMALNAS